MRPKMKYTWNEISFHQRKTFCLAFISIAGEMKHNFVSRVTGMNGSIKNVNKPERVIETSMLEAKMQVFIEEVLR